ncbi:hypothetical protein QE152_g36625 [Popillia japonica]|uniref:Uncharacterized protein n=1 Tax=Popillia japonica TaxID=7064 RepID=A0AAW1ICZ5_POPJA
MEIHIALKQRNASAATPSQDNSDYDLPLTAVTEELLSRDNQQELTDIRNHQHSEAKHNDWTDENEDLLPLHSNDSVSNDETVIDNPKVKHEEAISSFKTCTKWAAKWSN